MIKIINQNKFFSNYFLINLLINFGLDLFDEETKNIIQSGSFSLFIEFNIDLSVI
jgi:hypothetical protein